tara:strand:+ start:3591 stop:3992 length:402 start_codon:yes stop_codon:yes gene_type:complete
MLYIKAVEDFSTCGNALMPWGGNGWQPDEVEKPYVLQAKINQAKMQTEIDEAFFAEANLEELFVALKNDFYKKTADITASLKKLPAEDHSIIWNNLFEIEKDALLIRNKLVSDFRLHAEIIKMCANGLNDPTN